MKSLEQQKFERFMYPSVRICNPHAMSMSICNAHNNYFADCKSDGMGKNKLSQ